MLKIAVIILTYNEEKHIERCIKNAHQLSDEVYIVDSFSTDETVRISKELGAHVIQRTWPGNQAEQFNWALDNLDIQNDWILRLDADEYLLEELVHEILALSPKSLENVNGLAFNRRLIFLNKWIKRGAYPNLFLRIFRKGFGLSENRIMDEHIILTSGTTIVLNHDFVDHNLEDIDRWHNKHLNYANREVQEYINFKYGKINISESTKKKMEYYKLPLFLRCFMYFFYRYILKGGFIEGKESFIWNFYQGLWYRLLIDLKIMLYERDLNNNTLINKNNG